jgi:HD-GYP domain-containing protein (c-di-GMP phosphodiesterase class II)
MPAWLHCRWGLSEQDADTIYDAGLLHDIGKIAIQDKILENLAKLPTGGFEAVKKHPIIGARIIGPLSFLAGAAQLILHHHEHFDGSGYPEGLAGEAIPLGARIIAVSDCFDAMTSERPGTQPVSVQKALRLILEQAGTTFDPKVVMAFVLAIEKNPDKIKPFTLSEDYFTRHAEALEAPERRRSVFTEILKKHMLGL